MSSVITFGFAVLIVGMGTGFAGDVSGKATFGGAVPQATVIPMKSDPVCVKQNGGKTVNKEEVIVGANKGIANVFVYVKDGVKKESVSPAPTEAIVFDQKGCMYHPHVMGIRVGQSLKILNSDPTLHNVNALAKTNAKFNQGMPMQGSSIEKKFTKSEVMVKVKCDVHGWMNAFIGVVDNQFFGVTDDKGTFTIKGLPTGQYTLEAWHEKFGTKTASVTVADGVMKPVEFSF